jgi:hypothetical protein
MGRFVTKTLCPSCVSRKKPGPYDRRKGVFEGVHEPGPASRHREDDVLLDSAHTALNSSRYEARRRDKAVGVSEPTGPAIPHD